MAGIIDQTTRPMNTTVAEAQNMVSSLDTARSQITGMGRDKIKELFSYDKSLSDRYSSPDSKMFIENPTNREKAISGYSAIGNKQINNLFDMTEKIRVMQDSLKNLITDLTIKKAQDTASGGGVLSLSDMTNFMKGEQDVVPKPPTKLQDMVDANPDKYSLYYMKGDDGAWHFAVDPKGTPADPRMKEYSDKPTVNREAIMRDYFGVDKNTLAQLNAISIVNPNLADKLFTQIITSNVKSTATTQQYSTDDFVSQVKEYPNRAAAVNDLNANRSAMVAKGIDVARIERAIDTYFTEKEKKDAESAPLDFSALKKARGG